ncbi:MAG: DUF3488 and transglutaminase-like domain-containing protein [Synergistaceae bacterium]|jgi:transglutaminase-like putative cysteine protease|nr:DUF3488 and transglutaminase-like domain-containing protein [Synergistaceae bacterium]
MNNTYATIRQFSLKSLLYANTTICVLIAFAACLDIISLLHAGVFCALFITAFVIDTLGLKRPPRFALNIVSVCILVFAFMTLRYNIVIETFTGAVLLLISVKMLEEKRARDYIQVLGLSVLALLSSAVLSVDQTVLFFCFLASIAAGFELVLTTWFGREPGATLSSAALLRTAGASLAIWGTMLPICLALFFLAPRARTTMAQFQPTGQQRTFSGFSDQVTLGTVRDIQASEELAFRAEMRLIPPESLYWRGMILSFFNGKTWFPARGNAEKGAFTADGEQISQKILIEPGRQQILFALDKTVFILGDNIMPLGNGIFARMDSRGATRFEYTAMSVASMSMKPSNTDASRRSYLALPPDYSPRLFDIVGEISRGLSGSEKIDAVAAFLAPPNYQYTLEDLPVSENPLEDFIFSSKQGNCEFFASAMAVMLRMAGVPSRLVAGYQGGMYNQSGGYYIVRQSNAHVWVEAWNEESGEWERRDPTPITAATGAADLDQGFAMLSLYLDTLNYHVSRLFLLYDRESQSEILGLLRDLLSNPGDVLSRNTDSLIAAARAGAVIAACAAALSVLFAASKRINLRRRNRDETLLRDFLLVMKRSGYEKKRSEGLEEFAASIPSLSQEEGRVNYLARLASAFVLRFESFYYRDIPINKSVELELREILGKIKTLR